MDNIPEEGKIEIQGCNSILPYYIKKQLAMHAEAMMFQYANHMK